MTSWTFLTKKAADHMRDTVIVKNVVLKYSATCFTSRNCMNAFCKSNKNVDI